MGAVTSTGASRAGLAGGAATGGAPMALLPAYRLEAGRYAGGYAGLNGRPAGLLDFEDRERRMIHERMMDRVNVNERVMDRERRRGLLHHHMLMEDIDEEIVEIVEIVELDTMMEHRLGHPHPLHVTIGGAGDESDEGGHHLHGRARGASAVVGVPPACIADVDMADASESPACSHMDASLSPQPSRTPAEIQPEIANLGANLGPPRTDERMCPHQDPIALHDGTGLAEALLIGDVPLWLRTTGDGGGAHHGVSVGGSGEFTGECTAQWTTNGRNGPCILGRDLGLELSCVWSGLRGVFY